MDSFELLVRILKVVSGKDPPVWYLACPRCKSKVLSDSPQCPNCNCEPLTPLAQYKLHLCVSDGMTQRMVTLIGSCLDKLFGQSAPTLYKLSQRVPTLHARLPALMHTHLVNRQCLLSFRDSSVCSDGVSGFLSLQHIQEDAICTGIALLAPSGGSRGPFSSLADAIRTAAGLALPRRAIPAATARTAKVPKRSAAKGARLILSFADSTVNGHDDAGTNQQQRRGLHDASSHTPGLRPGKENRTPITSTATLGLSPATPACASAVSAGVRTMKAALAAIAAATSTPAASSLCTPMARAPPASVATSTRPQRLSQALAPVPLFPGSISQPSQSQSQSDSHLAARRSWLPHSLPSQASQDPVRRAERLNFSNLSQSDSDVQGLLSAQALPLSGSQLSMSSRSLSQGFASLPSPLSASGATKWAQPRLHASFAPDLSPALRLLEVSESSQWSLATLLSQLQSQSLSQPQPHVQPQPRSSTKPPRREARHHGELEERLQVAETPVQGAKALHSESDSPGRGPVTPERSRDRTHHHDHAPGQDTQTVEDSFLPCPASGSGPDSGSGSGSRRRERRLLRSYERSRARHHAAFGIDTDTPQTRPGMASSPMRPLAAPRVSAEHASSTGQQRSRAARPRQVTSTSISPQPTWIRGAGDQAKQLLQSPPRIAVGPIFIPESPL